MNILLIGEFSRLHNSLKEGLQKLGHHVVILGFKDGFKDFPVDYPLERKLNTPFLTKFNTGVFRLTGFNINSYFTYLQFKKNKAHFVGFDIVQLINENSFYCGYYYEQKILNYLFLNNKKTFLLCCGTDYLSVKFAFDNIEAKTYVMPYLDGKIEDKNFQSVLKFRNTEYKKLHDYIYKNIVGIIASDMDYHIPLKDNEKYLGMIPNPINTDVLEFQPLQIHSKVIIFHGINNESFYKKGNDFFEKALEIVAKKYPEKIELIITRSIPYTDYIKMYNRAHIVLDQVYAYDQGYNALEAMAKGKVVFTGAEIEFEAFYKLDKKVAINAKPDVDYLVNELSFLVENHDKIIAIGKNAREFIEKEHDYIKSAGKYLETWRKY